jgi:hypothetical protein
MLDFFALAFCGPDGLAWRRGRQEAWTNDRKMSDRKMPVEAQALLATATGRKGSMELPHARPIAFIVSR